MEPNAEYALPGRKIPCPCWVGKFNTVGKRSLLALDRDDGCRHSNKSSASAPSLGSRDILDENDGLLGKELLEWWKEGDCCFIRTKID
jgi:hypothetical protein